MMQLIVTAYEGTRPLHVGLANRNIHLNIPGETSRTDSYGRRPGHRLWRRLTVPDTPTPGRWRNPAESDRRLIPRQCLGTHRIPALRQLRAHARARDRRANRRPTRITWRFTRTDARRKFAYAPNLSTRSET
jgi:hypothetical protein